MKQSLSIIIPTWNEESNILPLVQSIHRALSYTNYYYELIFVDDNSKDNTQLIISALTKKYPIRLYLKKGEKGKATSLLEGFSHAKYPLLCMIDADLQYPPDAIGEMLEKIKKGSDIVVANRKQNKTNILRKVLSSGYLYLFGRVLHRFNVDVQSGLKVFRKEIIERLTLNPSPWTFDLEFLVKARNAGYKISGVNIIFNKRNSGTPKIHLHSAILQIGWVALKYRFLRPEIIPFHPNVGKKIGKGFNYKGKTFIHHSDLHHSQSAFYRLTLLQKIGMIGIIALLAFSLYSNWHTTIIVLLGLLTSLYLIDLLFNLYLVYRSFSRSAEITITKEQLSKIPDSQWPSYTVFCPLYKEWQVVPQFVAAMSNLDYPKQKLQVMLLLEEDDKETIKKIKEFKLPSYFQIIVVPNSFPKTKPKACNYGLKFAKGEYVVIYDAEDVPDSQQLKKAVLAFNKANEKVICLQAKLNFYNPYQNFLTMLFTAEYSLWFDLVLTGLQSINAPIPLGGTSNHFKTKKLREINGWDSFNVTEDADLGIRIKRLGYKTGILNSTTLEEANSKTINWIKQRSRWIKGYMQTYLVHMRHPEKLRKSMSTFHFFTFQLIIGGKVLSMFINPLMWITTILYFSFRTMFGPIIESFFPAPIMYMAAFSMIFGNAFYLYYYLVGCAKRNLYGVIPYIVFLIPLYALLMSIAAWQAVYELIYKPHHWSKTKHGLHLNYQQKKNAKNKQLHDSINPNEDLILLPVGGLS